MPTPSPRLPALSRRLRTAGAMALVLLGGAAASAAEGPTPQSVVDELLAADRAFSRASAATDVVSGLSPMFADDVTMPVPGGTFAEGKAAVVAALEANPENKTSRAEWQPVRGGVSADGTHGFTFGGMTIHKSDGSVAPAKYLAYWVRGNDGWRVAAYKRGRANEPGTMDPMPPALPAAIVPVDPAAVATHAKTLDAAERAFSDDAQVIGLGPAFARWGSEDAVNMGGPTPTFVVGAEAISKIVDSPPPAGQPVPPSAVVWAPDRVLVASSGDLGVTLGVIRLKEPPPEGQPSSFAFFTVWRRPSVDAPWRYVAE